MTDNSTKAELKSIIEDGKFYRLDQKRGIKLQSFVYDNAWDYYQQGLARFVDNGKIGFHDKDGNIVIAPKYDFAAPFEGGRSVVCMDCAKKRVGEHTAMEGGLWGAIDLKGNVVVPIEFSSWEEVANSK